MSPAHASYILIVDDDPVTRQIMQQLLSNLGHRAVAVESGEEALLLLDVYEFSAVITDCAMPNMDGYELTSRIRDKDTASGRQRRLILGYTASDDDDTLRRCADADMDGCLVKPINAIQLADALISLPASPASRPTKFQVPISAVAALKRQALNDLADVRDAISTSQWSKASRLIHRLRGAAAVAGASQLAEACRRIEYRVLELDLTAALSALEEAERGLAHSIIQDSDPPSP